MLSKKDYISKLEFKLTSKPPFSTRRECKGTFEKEAKTQELMDLEEELRIKIKKLERIAVESEEKMRDNKKFNSKEIIRVLKTNNVEISVSFLEKSRISK